MNYSRALLVALWLFLPFIGCRRSIDDKLFGRWETYFGLSDAGIASAIVAYNKDHTVMAQIEGGTGGTTTGTWRVEGNQIVTKVDRSTIKESNQGKEFRDTIVQLNRDVLVVKDSDQHVLNYKRLR